MNEKEILLKLAKYGIDAVLPKNFIPKSMLNEGESLSFFNWNGERNFKISKNEFKNLYLFAVGKASYEMFSETLKILRDINIKVKDGVVVTNEDDKKLKDYKVITSSHPIPDERSIDAAKIIIQKFKEMNEDDFFIFLLSGGGSALLELPIDPINLDDLRKATDIFLKSGMDIFELNTLRKHLSQIKGGKLARFTKARGVVLILSDVIGDDLKSISSGLLYCDSTSYKDVGEILGKYNLWDKIPENVKNVFKWGLSGEIEDTPNIENERVKNIIVSNNSFALKKIKEKCKDFGINGKIITSTLRGEAKEVAKALISIGEGVLSSDEKNYNFPLCLIFGGETTVNVYGTGRGGRNQELVLSALNEIKYNKNLSILSVGTDGIDGKSDAAGGVVNRENYDIAVKNRLNLNLFLKNNDSSTFLKEVNGLITTGKTGTNVCDIILLLINY